MNAIKRLLLGGAFKDQRAKAIYWVAIALLVSIVVFFVVMIATGFPVNRERFWEPFFLSWVSGAALFVASIFVALKQLDNPAAENSRRRMEILMKGKEGAAIEYFLKKFHEFEHYAEYSNQKIVFKDYSADGKRISVEKTVSMLLRNFVEDVWSNFTHTIAHDTGVDGDELVIMYFRVNGRHHAVASFNEGKERSTTYDIRIEPDEGVLVEFGLRHWIQNPQNLTQSVPRFTSKINLTFENHTNRSVVFKWEDQRVELPPGDMKQLFEKHNVPPGLAYQGEISAAS